MADQQQPEDPTPQTADLIDDPGEQGAGAHSVENEEIRPQTADLVDNPDEGAEGRTSTSGSGSGHEQGGKMAAPSYSDDEDRLTGNSE